LQPLDQGIIKAFKARYREQMLKSLVTRIEQFDSVAELCKEINVLDALNWINESWKETRIEKVSKCFKSSGFPISSEVNSADSDSEDADDDIPLNQLAKINTIAQVDRETLVEFDQHVFTFSLVLLTFFQCQHFKCLLSVFCFAVINSCV
jgi:hypothetical protein